MVGMTNLYRYYGTHILNQKRAASETFKGLVLCLLALRMSAYLLHFSFEVTITRLHGGMECKCNARGNHMSSATVIANKMHYFVS